MDEELEKLMQDVERCWQTLESFKETAEQQDFPKLFMTDSLVVPAYNDLRMHPNKEHARIFIRSMTKHLKVVYGLTVEGLEAQA